MSGYIGTQPVPQATQTRDAFTATAGQTSFATGGYTPQFLDVYLNGIFLNNGSDYTAANGSDVILMSGAAADDILEVVAYTTFEVASQTFTGTTTVDVLSVTGAATGTDLTLSGGVYLGGTGSANKLDDVEEGTFTPTISGGLHSGGAASGNYYKVGKLVHVVFRVYRPVDLSSSTDISIGNLPFSASGVQSQLLNVEARYANIDEKQIAGFSITNDSASGAIRIFADTSGNYDALQHVALTSSYSTISVSGTYQTA
jgi:hypothetical protein